ncbi:MAG: hypothetical protein IID15_07140 [Candidatus Marinimicrobia bacterium]|nr:hypothetical protein [Candidatus Neomarinimicrobiota bacterium]
MMESDDFDYRPDERLTDFDLIQDWWPAANLAAGFIFSDGVATTGPGPALISGPPQVPVYTIGVGDTVASVDLNIEDLHYPLSLLAQEQSEMRITVRGRNAMGQQRRLFVFHENELIFSKLIRFGSQDHLESVTAPVVGRLDATRFQIEIEVLPEESNIANNRREIQIDVLPGRRQVTVVTGGLSPNTQLWNRVIDHLSQVKISRLVYLRGSWRGGEEAFWREKQDLIILDNYPTNRHSSEHLDRMLEKIRRDRSAVIVSEGPDSGHRGFMRLLRELGVTVSEREDPDGDPSKLQLYPRTGLSALDRSGLIELVSGNFPPARLRHVMPPSSNRRFTPLARMAKGGWVIAYGPQNRGKRGVILLPGLSAIHLKMGRTAGSEFLLEAMSAMIEWTLEPEGFSPYVVQTDRKGYHLGEKVRFRALQRDRAGESMLQPVLTLEAEGPQNVALVTLNYNFESGEYEGEYWPSEPGVHRYRVEGADDDPNWQRFEMQAGRVELESLSQNRYGLQRLAEVNGGSYITLTEADQLWETMEYAPRTVARESKFNLWQLRYLAPVMLLLLTVEWVLRRRMGLI